MKEIGKMEITFFRDRGFTKVRINLIKQDRIIGFLRTI